MNTPVDIYQLLNTLIENKCINIKKSYKIYKSLIENNNVIIKDIYCKKRSNNGNLCLNKCIDNSKCCGIHDEIMRKNRKKLNLWRREINKINKIQEDIFYDEDISLSYIPQYQEIIVEPSAPLLQDIINPPDYMQKPDECGKTIINHINNKQDIISQDLQTIENNNKPLSINHLYTPHDKDELELRFQEYRNKSIIKNNLVDYIQDYQFTIMNKPINHYLDNINDTNFKELQIKGVKSHKIINELIAINISSYYKAYNRIPSTNFFNKYANTISTIISKIPK